MGWKTWAFFGTLLTVLFVFPLSIEANNNVGVNQEQDLAWRGHRGGGGVYFGTPFIYGGYGGYRTYYYSSPNYYYGTPYYYNWYYPSNGVYFYWR